MEIPLEDARRRAALLVVSVGVAAILIYQASVLWLTNRRIESGQLGEMERGAALTPGDGAAWDHLGRLRQWDFVNADLPQAIADYEKAVQVDPRSSHYWLDLASAYDSAGDAARAQQAYERAQSVYPLSAEVEFNYGNFLLRQQNYAEAYKALHQAVQSDPTLLPLTISRTWRSSEDVDALLDQVLPANVDAYLQALNFFGSIHQAEPGLAVWRRLVALGKPIPFVRAMPFLDGLIGEDRADDASRVWREALAAAGLPHDTPANHSLVWDGDFATDFANGGLGWRWNPVPGAVMTFDSDRAPNSVRSVRLEFGEGSNPSIDAPQQYVPVEPGRTYHFHAYMRTDQITSENGMQFSITDPNHPSAVNVVTENFTGSHPWTPVEADIAAGPNTHFLLVELHRSPSRLFDNKLGGTVWISDVRLVPSGPDGEQAP